MTPRTVDLRGRRFGRLVVAAGPARDRRGTALWSVVCDCGRLRVVRGQALTGGRTRSCGCLTTATHNGVGTDLYERWRGLRFRARKYRVPVCPAWETFPGFEADMGATFRPGLWLVRDDPQGPFSPENCRWAADWRPGGREPTMIEWGGRCLSVQGWAERLGLKPQTIRARLNRGWDIDRVLTTDVSAGARFYDPAPVLAQFPRMSAVEIARRLGVPVRTVRQWRDGTHRISEPLADRVAIALDEHIDTLWPLEDAA